MFTREASDMKMAVLMMLILSFYVIVDQISALFPQPAYTSDWYNIKSRSVNESTVTIPHNLNALPVKVLAEVRVFTTSGYMVFPADMGSSPRDDDDSEIYGGILTLYNESIVIIHAPNERNNANWQGFVIYTGDSGWQGPDITHTYNEADVRVKIWLRENFPSPDFESEWEPISIYDETDDVYLGQTNHLQINCANPTYKEIQHTLTGYPSFISVRVKSAGFVFEAQGLRSRQRYSDASKFAGVVYGFSDTFVRIWYLASTKLTNADYQKATIISTDDGWGDPSYDIIRSHTGELKVLAWRFPDSWMDTVVITPETLQQNTYTLQLQGQRRYINVEVEANDGYNKGVRFYGLGSATTDGAFGSFGGLVYAYSDQMVWFWWPNHTNGYILQLGDIMSYTVSHQSSNNVQIRINSFIEIEELSMSTYHQTETNKDVVPVSNTLWSKVTTRTECCRKCKYDASCKSVFYHLTGSICIGYKYYQLDNATTQTYIGMVHYTELITTTSSV